MNRFRNRRILITGGGSGLGLATANLLASQGAAVIAVDLAFGDMLRDDVQRHVADVTNDERLATLVARLRRDGGFVDGLATFAGIEMSGRIEALTTANWKRVLDVNVLGSVNAVNAVLPGMIEAGGGAILLCSSQLSLSGGRDCVAYATSKGAINSLCRSLALDHAASGIRVNAIAPGAMETPMMTRAFAGIDATTQAAAMARHALGRFGKADESAAAAAFLLSSEASFITGVILPVDGGWTAA
jgi:2-keto-3-deoxy-L-fuconate dehydrogenase